MKVSIVLFSLLYSSFAFADQAAFDKMVTQTKDLFDLPFATAVAVVRDDEVIYEGYFGFEDIEKQKPVDQNTSFYIASVTKPFFALTVLQSEYNQQIDTSSSLLSLFPDIDFQMEGVNKITIKHLLSHTSGISEDPFIWPFAYTGLHNPQIRRKLLTNIKPNKNTFPGEFEYANIGYNILGMWYEESLNTTWQQAISHHTIRPLKLINTSTTLPTSDKGVAPYALPYSASSDTPNKPLYLFKQPQTMHSAGGMTSTVNDLASFIKVQLNDGKLNGEQVIPSQVIQKSHQSISTIPNPNGKTRTFSKNEYGWGWFIGQYHGEKVFHHGGGYPGSSAHVSFIPKHKLGVAIVNNEGRLGNAINTLLADAIYQHLLGNKMAEKHLLDELHALKKAVDGFIERNKQRRSDEPENSSLTLPTSKYVGLYQHNLLGTVEVASHSGHLQITWGALNATSRHAKATDSVLAELVPERMQEISFNRDQQGNVTSLVIDTNRFQKTNAM
ncbi:serine hydrolase domain-containing protein [Alteromonas sp. ASW11-130]|uniref:serine hydrolase domain-containing protein n=1 Tax=Alteromonas sp. ASW11-130 TaxID=3015775 RepID=UPI002241FAB7|nr:serine hydrolase domain-containing protein [Alteromonas sp. ASW11-130]MCW8090422.1 serine hydrolase [Alteromonas sp. ASW11-130]